MAERTAIPPRLEPGKAILAVVDVQERFRSLVQDMDQVLSGTRRLIQFCQELRIPILVTEHFPHKLGVTVAEIRSLFSPFEPVQKVHFSCCGCPEFNTRLETLGRSQVILCGIEAHVCIYQTAADLMRSGRQVIVASDAVGSRSAVNRERGLQAADRMGAQILGAQMLMFEILHEAGTLRFKAVSGFLKE